MVPENESVVRWTGIDLARLEDGRIVELWASADVGGSSNS
jgi:predicted SnoaL-like aldol condensation-catalyzing enzyme